MGRKVDTVPLQLLCNFYNSLHISSSPSYLVVQYSKGLVWSVEFCKYTSALVFINFVSFSTVPYLLQVNHSVVVQVLCMYRINFRLKLVANSLQYIICFVSCRRYNCVFLLPLFRFQ